MQKLQYLLHATLLTFAPVKALAETVSYDTDGAILLGSEVQTSDNIIAAVAGSGLSLTCFAAILLMLLSIYIFHNIWHPKRVHERMTETEIKRGSIKFYIGGTFVWMLIAIMAESWCLLLPLTAVLAGTLIYYVMTVSSFTNQSSEV